MLSGDYFMSNCIALFPEEEIGGYGFPGGVRKETNDITNRDEGL